MSLGDPAEPQMIQDSFGRLCCRAHDSTTPNCKAGLECYTTSKKDTRDYTIYTRRLCNRITWKGS